MQRERIIRPRAVIQVSTVVILMASAGVVACSDSSSGLGSKSSAQLAFSANGASSTNAAAAVAPVVVGKDTLDLTQVSVTVKRAELKRALTDACAGDNEDDAKTLTGGVSAIGTEDHGDNQDDNAGRDSTCAPVRVGNTTVVLPLTDSIITIPANTIPAGTFRELELALSQVELKGTFDSKAFDVTIPLNRRAELQLKTPLVIAPGTATTVTVSLPVNTWLTNPDGSLVDPTKILSNPTLLAMIQSRITASLRAFEDRNHNGKDDDGERGHDGN